MPSYQGGILSSYPDRPGGSHGCQTSNKDNDRTSLGENRRGKGGRGRTGKDADVEDVDVKANGYGIALPYYSYIDLDLFVGKTMVGAVATAPAPPNDSKREPLKKTFSTGEPA